MKKSILSVLCAALFVSCLSGCVTVVMDFSSVTGKGDPEIYEIRVGEFSGVKIEGQCEIRYYAAPSDVVLLEVQPNLREYFLIEVINDDLVISTSERINFNAGNNPVITVSSPVLNRLNIAGVSTFTAYDKIITDSFDFRLSGAGGCKAELDVNNLYVDMSGTGSFELSGTADTATLNLSGAGNLDALSLQTREAKVGISGVGNVGISCSENLTIDANGMGSVEYKGDPSININRGGMVNVEKVGDYRLLQ